MSIRHAEAPAHMYRGSVFIVLFSLGALMQPNSFLKEITINSISKNQIYSGNILIFKVY